MTFRLPKAEDIDKQLKDNKEEVDGLKSEIQQRTLELKDLSEEIYSQGEQVEKLAKVIETHEKEEQDLKDELVKIHGMHHSFIVWTNPL